MTQQPTRMFLALRAVDADPWFRQVVRTSAESLGLTLPEQELRTEALAIAITHGGSLKLREYDNGVDNPDEVDCSGITEEQILQLLYERNREAAKPILPLEILGVTPAADPSEAGA